MPTKKYRIRLTTDEQQELKALVSRGRTVAYKQTHARILLMSDEAREDGGMKDADISGALGVGLSMVERVRRRCVEEGIESALNRKKQLRRRQKILDGEREARLIAMACGEPPEGRASWTLKLLADQLVECEIVETISTETVRQVLKKTNSSRG
jgi:transposase